MGDCETPGQETGQGFRVVRSKQALFARRLGAGSIRVGRVAIGVGRANPVVIGRVPSQARALESGHTGGSRANLGEAGGCAGRALDLEASFIAGVVDPAQVDLRLRGGCGRKAAWRSRW